MSQQALTPQVTAEGAARPLVRVTEHAVQRVADASIWLLFRVSRVRS